jgi:hypothetical protein
LRDWRGEGRVDEHTRIVLVKVGVDVLETLLWSGIFEPCKGGDDDEHGWWSRSFCDIIGCGDVCVYVFVEW